MITPLKLQFHVRGNQVPYMTEEWSKAICYRNSIDVGKSLKNTEMTAIISYIYKSHTSQKAHQWSFGRHAGLSCIQKTPNKYYDIALKEKKSR